MNSVKWSGEKRDKNGNYARGLWMVATATRERKARHGDAIWGKGRTRRAEHRRGWSLLADYAIWRLCKILRPPGNIKQGKLFEMSCCNMVFQIMPCAFTCTLVGIAKRFKIKLWRSSVQSSDRVALTGKTHANFNNTLQQLLFFSKISRTCYSIAVVR